MVEIGEIFKALGLLAATFSVGFLLGNLGGSMERMFRAKVFLIVGFAIFALVVPSALLWEHNLDMRFVWIMVSLFWAGRFGRELVSKYPKTK